MAFEIGKQTAHFKLYPPENLIELEMVSIPALRKLMQLVKTYTDEIGWVSKTKAVDYKSERMSH